jgi:dihydrofolate reductase
VSWNNSTLIKGDVGEVVAALKREDGAEIQVHGSGDLAQTLIERDLVDEFRLWVFPIVLGRGKRLFGRGTGPAALKLVDTKTSSTGVAIHTYDRDGAIQYGTFEVDEQGSASKLWDQQSA